MKNEYVQNSHRKYSMKELINQAPWFYKVVLSFLQSTYQRTNIVNDFIHCKQIISNLIKIIYHQLMEYC